VIAVLSLVLTVLAMIGTAYTLGAAAVTGRWKSPIVLRRTPERWEESAASDPATLRPSPEHSDAASITMLKPLHGPEPMLEAKLAGFLAQDYPGPIDMVCGVADAADPALDAVRSLQAKLTKLTATANFARHGTNGKVSNLINMLPAANGDILILSDSDMIVGPDYASSVTTALARPGVGAITLPYAGIGETNGWSRMAAAGISWAFLPSVMVGVACRLAHPCMGSTIALRRETLDAIGGFAPFADLLADDHAIGAAVRGLGLEVEVAAPIVLHGCTESSLAALWRHELRWNATVRMLDPAGYAGSAVTHAFAWSLLAIACGAGGWVIGVALLARLALAARIDAIVGRQTAPLWWLPARDLLSFGLYCAAFFTRSVDWRGSRLHMAPNGRLSAETETH
jgi:ceramide glucosyltransferase